jgi:predicted O-methyltransferase YrrM
MEIVHGNIVEYILNVTPERDEVLEEMERLALERSFPIIGPLVGRTLYLFAKITQAKRILEMGSGYGYSAYWFAKGTPKDAEIICTDGSADNAARAADFFKRGKINQKIKYLVGDALKLIDEVDGEFDIIFNDVDKHQYPRVFRKALPRLRKGGLFISDNVLWSGKILNRKPDADTAGILTYNRMIYSSKDLFTTILPIRDGVSVSLKL